jgi:ParB-like chromosome segregation protein Spo0J
MRVPLEEIFLGNQKIEANPSNQKESPFYKRVRDSIERKGMINPLLCIETQECDAGHVQEGKKYKCCLGKNRYLAAHELGIKEVPIKIVTSQTPKDTRAAMSDYIPTEVEGLPSRRRAYEANKK